MTIQELNKTKRLKIDIINRKSKQVYDALLHSSLSDLIGLGVKQSKEKFNDKYSINWIYSELDRFW